MAKEPMKSFITRCARFFDSWRNYNGKTIKNCGARARARSALRTAVNGCWHPVRVSETAEEAILGSTILCKRGDFYLVQRDGLDPFFVVLR